MRRKNTEVIGEVLKQFLEENGLIRMKLAESRVISGWGEVLGATVAYYTTNIYLKNGVLHVQLSSSVLRSELAMSKERIVTALNHHAGIDIIKDILFR
jgi:predicted nucleic acid-binding Zn ribbon protein